MVSRYLILGALAAPLVFGCANPASDACASAFTASAGAAITFCQTYTTAVVTVTTDLPAFATACSNSSKKVSSACTCLLGAAATGTVATTTCTASVYAQVTSVVASCTKIALDNIAVPANASLDLSGLRTGSTVVFQGLTTFGYTKSSTFNPIVISGTGVTITGAPGSVIDGNGQAYWDGKGSNGGAAKPDHFIVLSKMVASTVSNLYVQNWPVHCFDVTGCILTNITGLILNNTAGDAVNAISKGLPAAHNSDGFDISKGVGLIISDTIVINQDDCVAVTSGKNILVDGMTCSGGHGLSIGSIGGKSDNTVDGVTFSNSKISDSMNGCRIKTNSNTTGSVSNVLYKNIELSGITNYGIDVQQDYLNGGPTGSPTNGVTIAGVTFDNVYGTATSNARDYYVLCGDSSCSNFTFVDVEIVGGGKSSYCNFPATGCPVTIFQYYQCGGLNWTGAGECARGLVCQYENDYFSQCVVAPSTEPTIPEYYQCGGLGWTGSGVCAKGTVCKYENDYFSLCVDLVNA